MNNGPNPLDGLLLPVFRAAGKTALNYFVEETRLGDRLILPVGTTIDIHTEEMPAVEGNFAKFKGSVPIIEPAKPRRA